MDNKNNITNEVTANSETNDLAQLRLLLKENIPPILKYLDDQRTKHTTPLTKFTIGSFLLVIAIILIITGLLVYSKLLESSAFTFIVGTILGYLFGISKIILSKDE